MNRKPKIDKRDTTNDQRRQAVALIKGFPRDDKRDRRELTVQLGASQFSITIERKPEAA